MLCSSGGDQQDYAIPDITKSALVVNLPPRSSNKKHSLIDKPPNYDALYAAADIVNAHGDSMQVICPVLSNLESHHVFLCHIGSFSVTAIFFFFFLKY